MTGFRPGMKIVVQRIPETTFSGHSYTYIYIYLSFHEDATAGTTSITSHHGDTYGRLTICECGVVDPKEESRLPCLRPNSRNRKHTL